MPEPPTALDFAGQVERALAAVPALPDAAACWAALGKAGVLAAVYRDGRPERGVDPDRLGTLLAALDARGLNGVTLAACVQLATVLPLLAEEAPGSEALRRTLDGSATTALAATDEAPGSDLTALGTEVRSDEDGLVVRGAKRWITNATGATWLLVLARRRPGPHFTNFSWVLVPADAPGVVVRPADTDLFAGSGVGHVRFDDVRVPADHLVGRPGRGLAGFARHIAVERLAGALWAVALCRRALDAAKRSLTAREGLWQLDGVRRRFATCLVQVHQLNALAAVLGGRIATDHDGTAAALLKASVGLTVDRVLAECAHLHGADGFAAGGPHLLRAEAGVFGVGGGVTEVVLGGVADQADRLLAELGR
ncbi:acyl-CoA dehydrogenase family protein [Saccharothrix lopnurensis]|uniref:Acyl-CoA dehydrogenase family protein n=1 Tax=Saccharothrix lopnurensis TaxID=1670621 RepID=A0ABW1PF50_9PSEU